MPLSAPRVVPSAITQSPIADHSDRILVKIVHDIVPFFAHHVEMNSAGSRKGDFSLPEKREDARRSFPAWSRRVVNCCAAAASRNELRNLLLFP